MLHAFYFAINRGDLGFTLLELALRIQQVIDRRHKEIVLHATRQIARESCKITQLPRFIQRHQYTQHFSRRQFIGPIGTRGYIPLHLLDCHQCQRMRLIAVRASELLRQFLRHHLILLKWMKSVIHHDKITDFFTEYSNLAR